MNILEAIVQSARKLREYTDTSITKLTDGTIKVRKASSADSATSATQDASGNVISSTYETKSDAKAKLTEAKTYSDTTLENHTSDSTIHVTNTLYIYILKESHPSGLFLYK